MCKAYYLLVVNIGGHLCYQDLEVVKLPGVDKTESERTRKKERDFKERKRERERKQNTFSR